MISRGGRSDTAHRGAGCLLAPFDWCGVRSWRGERPVSVRTTSGATLCVLLAVSAGGGVGGAKGAAPTPRPAHLIVVSDRDGDNDVYSIGVDGRVAAITRNAANDVKVLLSPVGGWLAVNRVGTGAVLVRADGLYEAKLGKNVSVQAFSPDGRWLAVLRELNSGEEDQVTRIELVPVGFTAERRRLGLGTEVSFSTDGRRLGFIDEKSGVIDLRTGRRTVLLHQFPLGLQWSPNMTGLIIQRENEELRNGDLLYFRAASGAKARVIFSGPLPLAVAWLDEHRVGYDVTIRGVTTLMVRRVDGEGRRVIAQGKLPFHHWAPDGKSVAYSIRDGHAVTIASTSTSARRTISLGSGQLRNMTWLSSGRRLALFVSGAKGELVIVETKSGTVLRRIGSPADASWSWAPDESALAMSTPAAVKLLSLKERRFRIVWRGGNTSVHGWMLGRQPGGAPPPAPAPQPEVATSSGFRSRTRVLEISSSGEWVGAILAGGKLDSEHVVAWSAKRRAIVRFTPTSPGGGYGSYHSLSVKGSALRWGYRYCGNDCYLAPCLADALRPNVQRCDEEFAAPTAEGTLPRRRPPARETRRGIELTVQGGAIHLRRLSNGQIRVIRPAGRLVDADLEDMGLFYAYDASGTFRGRMEFVPIASLF